MYSYMALNLYNLQSPTCEGPWDFTRGQKINTLIGGMNNVYIIFVHV